MSEQKQINVGVIGCGIISSIYLEAQHKFDILNYVACADIDLERAHAQAQRYHVPQACTVTELLANPAIECVLNLTIPKVHAEISAAALNAGKAVYSEKPLGIRRAEGQQLLATAAKNNVRIGCAPDTFLGGGLQTCIKIINDGIIGEPVAATAFMLGHGPEHWHADPGFYYQPGAGPLFDMGPYYLTALVAMLGPVRRVSGSARITFPERTITSQPKYGQTIKVNTPTHVAGTMDFASGAIGTIIMSFDVWSHHLPAIEIYGTRGSLRVPDPNSFGGPVMVQSIDLPEWHEVPLTHGYSENSRGIGLADMANALRTGHQHRANGDLAYHVLDIMEAFYDSAHEGKHVEMVSTCERPAPLPPDNDDERAENVQ
jgi:Predicted dehydrogenases and related proteins